MAGRVSIEAVWKAAKPQLKEVASLPLTHSGSIASRFANANGRHDFCNKRTATQIARRQSHRRSTTSSTARQSRVQPDPALPCRPAPTRHVAQRVANKNILLHQAVGWMRTRLVQRSEAVLRSRSVMGGLIKHPTACGNAVRKTIGRTVGAFAISSYALGWGSAQCQAETQVAAVDDSLPLLFASLALQARGMAGNDNDSSTGSPSTSTSDGGDEGKKNRVLSTIATLISPLTGTHGTSTTPVSPVLQDQHPTVASTRGIDRISLNTLSQRNGAGIINNSNNNGGASSTTTSERRQRRSRTTSIRPHLTLSLSDVSDDNDAPSCDETDNNNCCLPDSPPSTSNVEENESDGYVVRRHASSDTTTTATATATVPTPTHVDEQRCRKKEKQHLHLPLRPTVARCRCEGVSDGNALADEYADVIGELLRELDEERNRVRVLSSIIAVAKSHEEEQCVLSRQLVMERRRNEVLEAQLAECRSRFQAETAENEQLRSTLSSTQTSLDAYRAGGGGYRSLHEDDLHEILSHSWAHVRNIPTELNRREMATLSQRMSEVERQNGLLRDEALCCVCLDQKRCVVLSCGHLCLCESCTQVLEDENSPQCPLCRENIESHRIVY